MGFHFDVILTLHCFNSFSSTLKKEHFEETAYLYKYLGMIKIFSHTGHPHVPANFVHVISTFHANFIAVRQ